MRDVPPFRWHSSKALTRTPAPLPFPFAHPWALLPGY